MWLNNTVQVEEETERQHIETGREQKLQRASTILDIKPGVNTRKQRDLGSHCCLEQVWSYKYGNWLSLA